MGNSCSNYGHCLVDKGCYEEAQVYYKRAIDVHERSKPPSSDLLEGAYSSMGKSMLYLNRLDEAEFWINRAIKYHKHFKTATFFVAETLFALGSLKMKQNRWDEAEKLITQSLKLRTTILGENACLVGVCLHHLGFIRNHKGDINGAIVHLRRAVAIFQSPAETQLGLLERSMLKLATTLARRKDKERMQEAMDLRKKVKTL